MTGHLPPILPAITSELTVKFIDVYDFVRWEEKFPKYVGRYSEMRANNRYISVTYPNASAQMMADLLKLLPHIDYTIYEAPPDLTFSEFLRVFLLYQHTRKDAEWMEVSLETFNTNTRVGINFNSSTNDFPEQFTNINDLYNIMVKELKQHGVTP